MKSSDKLLVLNHECGEQIGGGNVQIVAGKDVWLVTRTLHPCAVDQRGGNISTPRQKYKTVQATTGHSVCFFILSLLFVCCRDLLFSFI